MSFLKLENLTKIYGKDVLAIDDIDLEIKEGEFLVLLGPSGCGKTTTMRMIAGLETVTEGDIFLEGKSIINLPPREREVSMIFQSYAIWPHMTVYENIAYALKLQKMPKDEINDIVKEVAEMADILDYINRYPTQLSGGQQQRVAVARAMAVKPKLFLMDEPLSNLDAKLRIAMRTDLKEMHRKLGATTIFVTHDQAEAMSLADRIVVMDTGTIEQVGTPNEIYHDSKSVFVANFIGSPSTNFIDVEIVKEDNKYFAECSEFKMELLEEHGEYLKDHVGKKVILGVRPENFELVNGDDALINAKINIIEPQGSHSIVVSELMGEQIKVVTDKILTDEDKTIPLNINDKYFIFDKETERRIC